MGMMEMKQMEWTFYNKAEKIAFCKKWNLSIESSDIDVIQAATQNIEDIHKYGANGIESIEWLKGPLLELEETQLWLQLERTYNNAIQ